MRHLLVLLPFAVAACSSPSDLAGYVAAGNKQLCQHQVDCGFLDPAYESACEQQLAAIQLPTDQLKVTYDPSAGQTCLNALADSLRALGCQALLLNDLMITSAQMMSCRAAIHGTVSAGGACRTNAECADLGTCVFSFDANNVCSSMCVAPMPIGGMCGGSAGCGVGAYCSFKSLMCTQLGDVGAPCDPADSVTPGCMSGLACAPSADRKSGTCSQPLAAGSACAASPEARGACASGLICDLSLPNPICTPEKQAGEACVSIDACAARLICARVVTAGTCAAPLPQGASCFATEQCQRPHLCSNGTCTPPPDVGQPCPDGVCRSGFCNATKMCQASIAAGAACDPTVKDLSQCSSGNTCDAATSKCKVFCM